MSGKEGKGDIGANVQLSKAERRELVYVLHNACIVDGVVNVMSSIDIMVESLKRIILDNSTEKHLKSITDE